MTAWYDTYWWQWVFQNIVPTYVCLIAGAAVGFIFRQRIAAWWRRLVGERADLEDIRRMAGAAHKIAADLFEHHCGRPHDLAPDSEDSHGA